MPKRAALLVVLFLTAPAAWADPHSGYRTQQADADHSNTKSNGSRNAPFFVEVTRAPETKEELAKEDADANKKAAAEQRIVNLTADLAHYTNWLFKATAALGLFTFCLVVVGFYEICDARRSLRVAESAARSAAKTAAAAAKHFNLTERPYLFVFDVMPAMIRPGLDLPVRHIEYDVGNFGKIPAIIERVSVALETNSTGAPPDLLEVDSDHWLMVSRLLRPDVQRDKVRQEFVSPIITTQIGRFSVPQVFAGEDLYFRISIRYRGPFTTGHETAGWWIFDPR